jgi:16S rRNA G966 N2-methylase RsmD
MRLAAQMQGGFYPAHPSAVKHAASFLRAPHQESFTVLDPCAGEGAALKQLGESLACPQERLYAIELDDRRAETLHATLPDAHLLAPASFFGCRASCNSFSFVWLNPPFDDSYSGTRVEDQFLRTATEWLMPGGVLALVCPENVVDEDSDARQHFATYYEHCQIVPFPQAHRPFHEVIAFGQKRLRFLAAVDDESSVTWDAVQAEPGFGYCIPPGPGPRLFQKVEPTDAELQRMLAQSPLHERLTTPGTSPLPSPPLALGIGHVALLLASGHLDGVVRPEGSPPHVVRGISRKREYVAGATQTTDAEGNTITKTTISERIDLIIRTVDGTGRIRTYGDTGDLQAAKPN